ncbi:MAG: sigma-70 family RNA polymerase sigma factor [Chthoniobacteraceae bacterium]
MPTSPTPESPQLFATTRWSVVLAARDGVAGDAATALQHLCRSYWPSLYGYARRRGYSPHDAEDATQAFFARLLEKDYLQAVRRELGPFRAFLQMAFKRFLSKERDKAAALQRGGGCAHVPLDFSEAEVRFAQDAPNLPADEAFELQWAMTVLAAVMQALREEFRAAGREKDFDVLKVALSVPKDGLRYDELSAGIGASEGAARVAVHRMRKRFRELFRNEVAQTVAQQEAVDVEMQHLVSVLARA